MSRSTPEDPGSQVPLVVDLDGTLISTDLLHETASAFLTKHPHRALRLVGWTLSGRSRLKHELAQQTDIDVASLPYRPEVLAWLREERESGRRVVLATASTESLAQAVAAHLGLFDDVIASDGTRNLKSAVKAQELVARYGVGGFEYVGDHKADLAVWRDAGTAHLVGGTRVRAELERSGRLGRTFETDSGGLRDLVRALRPHQWVKNILILLPLLTAQMYDQRDAVVAAVLATVAFSIAASGVYVLNDLADVTNDRHHPTKKRRPFAAGRLSLLAGWLLWPLVMVLALGLAAAVSWQFLLALVAYLALTTFYTFWGKRKAVVDVVSLGLLYTMRIVAGAAAIEAPLSIWLLTFSLLFFFSLALIKRVSELTRARSELTETRGRGYRTTDLELLSSYGVASSIGAVVIFSLYVNDPETADLYATPEMLWVTVPVLLVWLMRSWLIAHRGEMNEDPILFAIRDRVSILTGALVLLAFVAARLGVS